MIYLKNKGIDIPGLVTSYYEIGPIGNFAPGQIVIIPSLYPNKDRLVLKVDVSSDPSEKILKGDVTPLSQPHIPVRSMGLASDEYAFVIKGKPRPAVVLGGGFSRWPTNPSEQLYVCAPLYSTDKQKITQRYVIEAQALLYPSMFYIPSSALFHIEESIARFALIQVAHGTAMKPAIAGNKPVMLSGEFFKWMRTQLVRFIGGSLPHNVVDDLKAYGELVLNEAKLQGMK